jgi:uncharacterized delta-60 repeat protein
MEDNVLKNKFPRLILISLVFSGLACGGGSSGGSCPDGGCAPDGGNKKNPDAMIIPGGDGPVASSDLVSIDHIGPTVDLGSKPDGEQPADARTGDATVSSDRPIFIVPDAPGAADHPIFIMPDAPVTSSDGPVGSDVKTNADTVTFLDVNKDTTPQPDSIVIINPDVATPPDATATPDATPDSGVAAVIAVDPVKCGPNAEITVTIKNGPTDPESWVGIFPKAAADNGGDIDWKTTSGQAAGTFTFTAPVSGTYNFRLFGDYSYDKKVATSPDITVSFPYDLDVDFGEYGDGSMSFDYLYNGRDDSICAVIPLASGKIVLVGSAKTGEMDTLGNEKNAFAVAQLTSAGVLDYDFATYGTVNARPTTHSLVGCTAAVVQADGKIVVGGYGYGDTTGLDYILARFTSAGDLDTTFGTAGFVTTNFKNSATSAGESDKLLSLAALKDGRILAGGEMIPTSGTGRASLARYTSTGALDTAFGGTGMVTIDLASLSPASASAFDVNSLIVADSGAAFAGITAIVNGGNLTAIASLKADGNLDVSFGTSGVRWESKPGTYNDQRLVQLTSTANGLLMLGRDNWAWFLGRYTPSGAVDTAFGSNGQIRADFSSDADIPGGMVVSSDGSILVGLSTDVVEGATPKGNMAMVRHVALGQLDNTFGKLTWQWSSGSGTPLNSRVYSIAAQADGKLLLGGMVVSSYGDQDFALIRVKKQW